MSAVVVSILGAIAVGALCLLGPQVIRRLPEPPPPEPDEPEPAPGDETERDVAVSDAAQPSSPMAGVTDHVKVPYVELAGRPGLTVKLALVGVVAGAVVGAALPDQPVVLAWLFLAVVGVWLGYVDAQTRLLPTRIIAPSYVVLVVLLAAAAAVDGETDDLLRAAYGWAFYGGFFLVMWLVYPRGLGYGDVRLGGLLGLGLGYLGWGELFVGIYSGLLLGGVIGAVLALAKVVDRKRYPFGPFMLLGALVGVVAGAPFADWYTGG